MNKIIISDIKKNLNLFFGIFFAIMITTGIICACLNLVFSSTATFDSGHRFDATQLVVMADQNITITYTEKDGDIDHDSERVEGRIPLSMKQINYLQDNYECIPDYSFYIDVPSASYNKLSGHNVSSMELTGFKLNGFKPLKDQIIVDENLAESNDLSIGDIMTIETNSGVYKYQISGIATCVNDNVYHLQNYIFFPDEEAEENALGCFSMGLNTTKIESTTKALKSEGFTVLSGASKSKAELPNMINHDISLMVIFITMGAVCFVISMFVISGTVQFSIRNRFRTLALLRVIGLTKHQIKKILANQTLIIGLIGGTVGMFIGMPIAKLIISTYKNFGIVGNDFIITHSWLWDGCVIITVLIISMLVTVSTANKPLSVPPASAIKNEGEFTSKTSVGTIITGIVLILGGFAIIIFTPLTGGIGIGMEFCACAVLLGGMMCLTPIIMKLFNWLFSILVKRFTNSLGQVANANVKVKASKFAVAAVSIAIMLTMGTVMMLNNITYTNSIAKKNFEFADDYNYISENLQPYAIESNDTEGIKNCKFIFRKGEKLKDMNALAVYGNSPQIDTTGDRATVSDNTILLADNIKGYGVGDEIEVWLEDGTNTTFSVGGKYHKNSIQGEDYDCIVSFDTIKNSLYNTKLSYVYTNIPISGSSENNYEYYLSSPSYNIQLGASLLLGGIGIILSIVALFNTFAVIMSVRKKEFNGLKIIGAKKGQILKMTLIETLIVTVTGLLIGFGILVLCVGTFSSANIQTYDYIVNDKLFYGTLIISAVLGILAGMIPSISTISKLKHQFRNE